MKLHKDSVLLFRTQLSLALLPIVVLPLAIVGYFSYNISYHALQARSSADVSQISALVNQNLDNTLQQAIQQAKTPLYNEPLQKVVTYYSEHPEFDINNAALQDIQTVKDFAFDILLHDDNIDSVDIYSAGKTVFSQTFCGCEPFTHWESQTWFTSLMHSPARTMILPTHIVQSEFGERAVFSVAQAIVNTETFQTVGAIVINMDTRKVIDQTIASSDSKSDTIFLIYSANGQNIYATPLSGDAGTNTYTQNAFQHAAQQALQQGKGQFSWGNTDYYLSSTTSHLANLTVAALVPSSSLMQDIEAIKQTTVLLICLTLLVVLGCGLFLIHRVSRQITQLRYLMTQVETGDLDVRFQAEDRSEITLLGRSFNRMVTRLKQLIQDNYEAQLQQKKAELAALQSQIHPHFLYNTLGTFQMIALIQGQQRLANIAYELGKLMRYSLEADDLVELGQELEHAQHFLSLIKERYDERLQFAIHVPQDLLSYRIPKFTLQPLIENAVYHGIDPKIEGGTVQIYGYERDQQLMLEIVDDGVGMNEVDIVKLREALRYEASILKRSKHIGMLNVQGQIQRTFGVEYGIFVEANEKGGMRINLHLPLYRENPKREEAKVEISDVVREYKGLEWLANIPEKGGIDDGASQRSSDTNIDSRR